VLRLAGKEEARVLSSLPMAKVMPMLWTIAVLAFAAYVVYRLYSQGWLVSLFVIAIVSTVEFIRYKRKRRASADRRKPAR
jgi:hypothetical protein